METKRDSSTGLLLHYFTCSVIGVVVQLRCFRCSVCVMDYFYKQERPGVLYVGQLLLTESFFFIHRVKRLTLFGSFAEFG